VFVNGFAACGPGFRTASELWSALLARRDLAREEMDRKISFDHKFFHISREQSSCTDPQIRLLLELTYEALVEAGVQDFSTLPRRDTGVYVGSSFSDFQQRILADDNHVKGGDHIGAAGSMLANRISQYFRFGGPSMKVDSACSSSLQALDIACSDIKSGKVKMAIVAGSNLIIDPMVTKVFQDMHMVSVASLPAACKTFSGLADGYVRKEAISVLVISSEEVLESHGISSVAEILGHCTLSGSGRGITTPCVDTQELLYRKVATMAKSLAHVNMPPVRYVECHGTGTKVGDEAETLALANIIKASSAESRTSDLALYINKTNAPLLIGSVKSNIGHTEAASGLMGVIKVLLSLEYGNITANLHYSKDERNQMCRGLDGMMNVVDKLEHIEKDAVAVINSFGFGGTYAQVMLRGMSSPPSDRGSSRSEHEAWTNINAVMGRTEENVRIVSASLLELEKQYCCVIGPPSVHNNEFGARAFTTPMRKTIRACAENDSTVIRPVWMIFSGNGADWPGMGFELYNQSHIYKETYDRCNNYLCTKWGCSSLQRLLEWQQAHVDGNDENQEHESPFRDIVDATVCLTSLQVCLINILQAVQFTRKTCGGYIGYSAGEIAAGYFDGSLSLETTLDVSFLRGQAAADVANLHRGAMLVVSGMSRNAMECILSDFPNSIVIACHTGPKQLTLSGLKSEVEAFEQKLKLCRSHRINTYGVPFHSPLIDDRVMETLEKKLDTVFETCQLKKRTDRWISSCYEAFDSDGDFAGSSYYCNGFKKCVEFERACCAIPEGAIIIECGPSGSFRSIFAGDIFDSNKSMYMSLLHRKESAVESCATVYGNLFLQRVLLTDPTTRRVSPKSIFSDPRQRAFRETFLKWDHGSSFSKYLQSPVPSSTLSGSVAKENYLTLATKFDLDGEDMWLRQHRVDGRCLLPAAVPLYVLWKCMHVEKNEECVITNFIIRCPLDISTYSTLWLDIDTNDSGVTNRAGPKFVQVVCYSHHNMTTSKQIIASCYVTIGIPSDNESHQLESCSAGTVDVQDLYHRLGRHDYNYGNDFKIIESMSTDKSRAVLKVGSHGVKATKKAIIQTFEGILQLSVINELGNSQYGLCMLPVNIDRVALYPSCHSPFPLQRGVINVNVHADAQHGTSLTAKRFLTITRVLVQKRSSSFISCDKTNITSIGKLELVPVTRVDGVDDNDNFMDIVHLTCVQGMSNNFDHWKSKVRQLPESLDRGSQGSQTLLISDASGFYGFVRSLQREPAYAHVRGLQILNTDYFKSDDFKPLVRQAQREFLNRSCLSCLFVGSVKGDTTKLLLLEEHYKCLDEIQFPSPHGCFLSLSADDSLTNTSYCWKPIIQSTMNSKLDQTVPSNSCNALLSCSVEIKYASLNFRDAMIRRGLLNRCQAISGYGSSGGGFGLDFAGYRISTDQSDHNPSKLTKVIGLGRDCIASNIYTQPTYLTWELPDNADLQELATVPCAYATAYYALCIRGELRENDRILIHCGAGGVGQAAIFLCKNRLHDPASQLFVTCGNELKRNFIHEHFGIPLDNIGDSRHSGFRDLVMKQTHHAGVRLVLNSLVGNLMEESAACLSFGGMLLELGKADMEPRVMRELRNKDRQLVMIDLDQLMTRPMEFKPLHDMLAEGLLNGEVRALECKVYPSSGIDDAFESMLCDERIGKVLVMMDRKNLQATVPAIESTLCERLNTKKQVIIIVGGFGGLGLCLIQWLAVQFRHVCNLVVCTSSNPNSFEKQEAVKYIRQTLQTSLDIHVDDFSDFNVVNTLMLSFCQPQDGAEPVQLRGFFNAAAMTKDMLFDRMDSTAWSIPFSAKSSITDNFSRAFENPKFRDVTNQLRYFVCFSSIVVGVGNQGQTNYACANAAMEDIVARRNEKQLPGLCIRLGVIPHTGLAASMRDAAGYAHLCPVGISSAMEHIERLTLSEQNGIFKICGANLANEGDVSIYHGNGILCSDTGSGYILDIFRKHVQDGIIHEQTPISKHSFDSLGMHILYDDLKKCCGSLSLSMDELFILTPMEVADRYTCDSRYVKPSLESSSNGVGNENTKIKDCDCPVIVIVTIGNDSGDVAMITSGLCSIRDQTYEPDAVLVILEQQVAETNTTTVMTAEDVSLILPSAKIIYNNRTKNSMAGAVNTGIMEAFSESGVENKFWVSFLDTSKHRWQSTHLERCVQTAMRAGRVCGWVIDSASADEDIKSSDVKFFYQSDPRSSWLVRCTELMEAGMFDEALGYTMDFDLSIRLCDVIGQFAHRAVTGECTIFPQQSAPIVTTSLKSESLLSVDIDLFFYKHDTRMTQEQLDYAIHGFGNGGLTVPSAQRNGEYKNLCAYESVPLRMWNNCEDREIVIRRDTSELLRIDDCDSDSMTQRRKMLVGITSSDTRRLSGVLGDLGGMLANKIHCVLIFANNTEIGFVDKVSTLLAACPFRGHVIRVSDRIVQELFPRDIIPLPIAKSRTVLQTFMHATTKKEIFDVVAVLDDDSRLPRGWGIREGDEESGDILLGRAIKTPPNPTSMSMRTQLIDFLYALDIQHGRAGNHISDGGVSEGNKYPCANKTLACPSMKVFHDMHDQYYDLSSSRWDHLELPRIFTDYDKGTFVKQCRHRILVGDPLAREAVSTEDGESCQRGGCMVLFRKQFHLLQYKQIAPTVLLASGRYASSRRSDTFWVMNHHQAHGKKPVVRRHLSFLHDNMYDSIPSPEKFRESAALEMIGAILCRPCEKQKFSLQRTFSLRCSIARIRGICKTLRGRSFFLTVCGLASFVEYLEMLFDEELWEREVFDVIDKNVRTFESWQITEEYKRVVPNSFTLSPTESAFVVPMYPNTYELCSKGPLLPIPCLHRIHETNKLLQGAQKVQHKIGMSLLLAEVENRLRQFSQLARIVSSYRDHHIGHLPNHKALVTIDDGFKDVILLRPIFQELSDRLQPVLCVPSAILRGGNDGIVRRHLPLTCLYDYCNKYGIDPDDKSKLGLATRSKLKTLPELEQYERLQQIDVPIDLSTNDLLSIQDIRNLSKEGWWVCSHGPDHCDLTNAKSLGSVLRELELDFALIKQEHWAPWFAWPEGRWCARTADAIATQIDGATVQFGLSSCPEGESQHPSVLNRVAWLGEAHRHRVLVTGSSGFLGQHLLLVLQGYGYDVFSYDIADGKDILDKDMMLSEMKRNKITTCIHLAAVADLNEVDKRPDAARKINVEGTRVVLSCCDEVGVRLLFASTCCVYGNNNVSGSSNESSPVNPTELYAETKLKSEQTILTSSRTAELCHVVMRLATFYGPSMRSALATSLFLKAAAAKDPIRIHGDGKQTRCFTHVHDIAEGIRVILQTTSFSGVVNVADDRECSVNALADIAMQATGNLVEIYHVEDRRGQIQRSKIDNSRLRGLGNLGWQPTVSLEAGMLGCIPNKIHPLEPKSSNESSSMRQVDSVHEQSRLMVAKCKLEHTLMPLRHDKCNGVLYVTETLPDGTQLAAFVVGDVQRCPEVHVRIHSECLTGDILGSLKCDCGPQKQSFLDFIGDDRPGVFVYVKGHEGRGAGLVTKTRAYYDLDHNSRKHHNDALLDAGAEKVDSRRYGACACLILRVISEFDSCNSRNRNVLPMEQEIKLLLHTNNKDKFESVCRAIGFNNLHPQFSCHQHVIPAGENCNDFNRKYLLEKEQDNGQHGLSVCSVTPKCPTVTIPDKQDNGQHGLSVCNVTPKCPTVTIPDNIDKLPGVETKINEVKFNANDPAMFDFLKQNGYVVVRGLVSSEQINKAKKGYEFIQRNLFEDISHRINDVETEDSLCVNSTDCTKSISQVRDLFLREENECSVFRELVDGDCTPNIVLAAQNAMNALDPEGQWTGIKLLHDHVITKPTGLRVSKRIPLHQDRMFWPVDLPACSTWVPLVDVPLNGGCMELLTLASKPHLHHQSVRAVDFMADEKMSGLKLVLEDDPHPVRWMVPMDAGETLIFSSHAWHRSSPNYQSNCNRMAYIQTWVHPLARWRPDLVPWHPVNEHLRLEGCREGANLAGKRHPAIGSCSDEVFPPTSCYLRTESVHVATKHLSSHISMFDAGDVISTQLRNIFLLRLPSPSIDPPPEQSLSLVDLIKVDLHRNQLVECTLKMLKERKVNADDETKLSQLYEESGCSSLRDLVTWSLKEIMISTAAYECDRSRNVFNGAYSAWWSVAGEAWYENFLTGKFISNYKLCKTDVDRYLKRIDVNRTSDVNKLDLLCSVIHGSMLHIPFQNFSMLTRVQPTCSDHLENYRCPPNLGDIIDDMLTGLGGLCSVRNPFLYLLLRALGFQNVKFVSGTMCLNGNDELVDAHVALLVSVDDEEYWVDIANGWPYMKPIALSCADDSVITHPFLDTRLLKTIRKGKSVYCVQHRRNPNPEWKDNYYFEPTAVDYDNVFGATMQKHYNSNFGPFLRHLRFNMWSEEDCILLRDTEAVVVSSKHNENLISREESWDTLKFTLLLGTSSFVTVDSLNSLIPEAWNICQVNAEKITEAEKITVTGGFFGGSANGYVGMITVWRSQESNNVLRLTYNTIREYAPETIPVVNKGFAGGSWHNDELYVCWPNRVDILAPSKDWEVRAHIDNPGFNDLHHVHACKHGIWVANTGCDTIDEMDVNGTMIKRYPLSRNALDLIGEGADLRDQKAHTVRRNCPKQHVNYVSPRQCSKSKCSSHDMTATLLQSKRVVSIENLGETEIHPPSIAQLPSTSPPHEGFIATVPCVDENPLLWNSTVDGNVMASNPHTGEIVKIWKIGDYIHLPRGWTRGLVLLDDGFLVGCTSVHGDASSWIGRHYNKWDFDVTDSQTAVSFIPFNVVDACGPKSVSFFTDRKGKIFSLLRTPPGVSKILSK
jgi:acyl transferase domain-containing protein/nucleoside-diphosphate-sugar epimerase/NADPH:quinone reductase-like Zn-dependent oxidoreductase/GTP cyclohydrolase II/arylamine N-acetyltransferase/ectoine hydroxylase-related dioxygenase (phytanoyl-CoA dioxygenase family)